MDLKWAKICLCILLFLLDVINEKAQLSHRASKWLDTLVSVNILKICSLSYFYNDTSFQKDSSQNLKEETIPPDI